MMPTNGQDGQDGGGGGEVTKPGNHDFCQANTIIA